MIITKLQGGLGNQMFQLAAGFTLAKFHNVNLKIDLSFLKKNNISTNTFTARKYELGIFNHDFQFANKKDIDFYFSREKRIIRRIIRKIKKEVIKPIYYKENFYSNDDFFSKTCKNTYLDGYWQSENFFLKYRGELFELFKFPELSNDLLSLKNEIQSTKSVSIHFRRGDYVNKKHINSIYGVCDFDYYERALHYINKKIKEIKLFVFSDEPNWVEQNFETDYKYEVIKTNSAISDMHLMSFCKHNIIANSSFSWWGAWLNQNPDKIIVAPKKWFNNEEKNKKMEHLLPKSWIKL